jgi:16S rRNA C967 or C1407 C5-methylase (RsmB/RsmF family)
MAAPSNLLVKLSRRVCPDPADQAAFIAALTQPQPFHPCVLWCHEPPQRPFSPLPPMPWQPSFVDRLPLGEQPGKHPLHGAGYAYCLDFSSVFAASVLGAIAPRPSVVVDVCASPGGKSIFAWRSLQPTVLIANETIGKRIPALRSNLNRCRIGPALSLSADPQVLADLMPQTATVVLVDAPCTGQSLLAKGGTAPGCFHPVTINKNANRQKRILANAAQLVAPGGWVVYMTCAYSPEENEQVGDWFLQRFPQFEPVAVPALTAYQSQLSDRPCYRMFPQGGLGAGAFTLLLRHGGEGQPLPLPELSDRPGLRRHDPGADLTGHGRGVDDDL